MVKKKKIGIALSGGGARGYAHLGVMKALYEKGIYPDVFSGTSAGAMAGIFLANGADPDHVFKFLKARRIFDVSRIIFPRDGLLNMYKFKKEFEKELEIKDLKETKKQFYACVSNMTLGKVEYLNEGPAVDIILASASIPVLFSPVKVNGYLYSDGGIFDNLPVNPIRDLCEIVIGVHVNPIHEQKKLDSLIRIAARTFNLTINNKLDTYREMCNVWIAPDDLDNYELLEFQKSEEIYNSGYEFTKNMKIDL